MSAWTLVFKPVEVWHPRICRSLVAGNAGELRERLGLCQRKVLESLDRVRGLERSATLRGELCIAEVLVLPLTRLRLVEDGSTAYIALGRDQM